MSIEFTHINQPSQEKAQPSGSARSEKEPSDHSTDSILPSTDHELSRLDLLQLLSDLQYQQSDTLNSASADLYNIAGDLQQSAFKAQNASSRTLQTIWLCRQQSDLEQRPILRERSWGDDSFRVLEQGIERAVTDLAQLKVEADRVKSVVNRWVTLGFADIDKGTDLNMVMETIQKSILYKLGRWNMQRQAQSTNRLASGHYEPFAEDARNRTRGQITTYQTAFQHHSSIPWSTDECDKHLTRQENDEPYQSLSPDLQRTPFENRNSNPPNLTSTHSTNSLSSPDPLAFSDSDPDSEASLDQSSGSDIDYRPDNDRVVSSTRSRPSDIRQYFQPVGSRSTRRLKRTRSTSTSSTSQSYQEPRKHIRRDDTRAVYSGGVTSNAVIAAAERFVSNTKRAVARREHEWELRGEIRSTGCD